MRTKKMKQRKPKLHKHLEVNTAGMEIEDAMHVKELFCGTNPAHWDCAECSPEYQCNTNTLADLLDLDPGRLLLKRKIYYHDKHTNIVVKIDILYATEGTAQDALDNGIYSFRLWHDLKVKQAKISTTETKRR